MASHHKHRAFSSEASPEHSDYEDDADAPGDTNLRNPLSSASRPGPDDVTSLLHEMQIESERSRQREQALLQRLAAAEQRLATGPAPRGPAATASGRTATPSVSATTPLASAGPSDPGAPTISASSRNPSPFMSQIPDSDPGKEFYDLNARKMSMLVALFPVHEDFTRPLPDFDPTSATRFTTPENCARGHTADIYSVFPPVCHTGLRNSARVRRAIINLAGGRRHLATHSIQNSFHDVFADLPEGLRNALRTKDWTYPKATFMVQGNSQSWTKLKLCPAYYPEGQSDQAREVFRAPWLIRLARRILYSSTALQSAVQREPLQKTDGMRWKADVTAGLIAMCCVLIRFALGPDKSFTNLGDESKFDFAAGYLYLKNFILKALALGHKWAITLITFWRTQVLAPSVLALVLGEDRPQRSGSVELAEDEEHLRLLEEDFEGDFENYGNYDDGDDGHNSDGLEYEAHPSSSAPAAGSPSPVRLTPTHTPHQDPRMSHDVPSPSMQPSPASTILFATNSSALRPFTTTPVAPSAASPHNTAELQVLVGGVRRTIRAPPGFEDVLATPGSTAQSGVPTSPEVPEHGLVTQAIVHNGEVLHVLPYITTIPCDQPEHCHSRIGALHDAADSGPSHLPDLAVPDESVDADDMPALLPAEALVSATPQVKPRPRPKRAAVAQVVEFMDHQESSPSEETVAITKDTTKTTKRKSTRVKKA